EAVRNYAYENELDSDLMKQEEDQVDLTEKALQLNSNDFAEFYFKKMNIWNKRLENKKYGIKLTDFLNIFTNQADLQTLRSLSENIDSLIISEIDCKSIVNLCNTPEQYRNAISSITQENMSLEDLRIILKYFKNATLNYDSIKPVEEKEEEE